MKRTIAIFSPNNNTYSETFIQVHKLIDFEIKFYYGGWLPTKLENKESIFKFSFLEKIKIKLDNNFSIMEHAMIFSLKKEKVTAVLVEYGPTACESLKLLSYLQIPFIVHFHGFDASHKPTIIKYHHQYQSIFKAAKSIIAVSKKMIEDLKKIGCPEEKIIYAPYGPNPIFINCKPNFKKRQFLSVGRFTDKKAPYFTIAAFKKVVEIYPDSKLIMCGEGELLNVCKNLSVFWGLQDNIEFKGVVTPEEVMKLLENSLAFLQHSIVAENGDSEGTPVAVLEAQAASIPVISTYHAGIQDIVLDAVTGFLVEEKDVFTMSNRMIEIIEVEGLAEKMGKAGRKRIIDHFSQQKNIKLLTELVNHSIIS